MRDAFLVWGRRDAHRREAHRAALADDGVGVGRLEDPPLREQRAAIRVEEEEAEPRPRERRRDGAADHFRERGVARCERRVGELLVGAARGELAAARRQKCVRADVVEVAVRVDDQERRPLVAKLFSEKLEDKVGVIRRADAGVDQHDEERRGDDVEERVLVEPVL